VFVIEHNIDILVQADWLIELGPEGGPKGGKLIFEGSPSQLIKATTPTAKALTKQIAKS
jgi:excinuclease ABC subunit A